MKHYATKKQEEAFGKVVKAFNEAKKAGLVFYGKSGSLVAYTKIADKYNDAVDFEEALSGNYGAVPFLTDRRCISDSGADDYACYRTEEDSEKYS